MALDLHIAGPGVDVHRRLEPGEPALVLGRDTDCAVCLPDPERNISRRHLSVWNEGDELHFHVLSVVNGVDTAGGELPPGSRGTLPAGEVLGLSAYRISAQPVPSEPTLPSAATSDDPWAEFERVAAQMVPDISVSGPVRLEDDPFGDWGFQSTFGPGSPGGSLRADALQAAETLKPFFTGLGMEAAGQAAFTNGELETMGRLTRIALQGLLQAFQAALAARTEARSEDLTVADGQGLNPLRMDSSVETKLYYLFGGQIAGAGFMPPDRAVAQVVTELTVHQQAMGDALREVAEKIVEEFDPEAVKKRLLGGSPRIFESARAWDAFARDYAERAAADPAWAQQLLDRHFARAYAKALVRAKRNTPARNG